MSRIGRSAVAIPASVSIVVSGSRVDVSGPVGKTFVSLPGGISLVQSGSSVSVVASSHCGGDSALHGLTAALLINSIKGVSVGWEKRLELVGVGYQAALKGGDLSLQVGFAHPVIVRVPSGIRCEVPDSTHVVVRGVDRQLVGQVSANIRAVRPPEPYKGKGIKYSDESIRRKAGKAFGS